MNKVDAKRLHALIVEKGTQIHNVLPAHRAHPDGRIGIAHIYSVIKSVMGVPMKECRDCRIQDIEQIIQYVVDNAKEHCIMDGLSHYEKEPVYKPVTLDAFL